VIEEYRISLFVLPIAINTKVKTRNMVALFRANSGPTDDLSEKKEKDYICL